MWSYLHLAVRIATLCAFVAWLHALYQNVRLIDGATDHEGWWAIAGFVIPPFVFFRPCEIAIEIWKRTASRDSQPIIVYMWWASFLNATILFILGHTTAASMIYVASAAIACVMVHTLTKQEREARLAKQREDRRAKQEAQRVKPVTPPAPVPSPSPLPQDVPAQLPLREPAQPPPAIAAVPAPAPAQRNVTAERPVPISPRRVITPPLEQPANDVVWITFLALLLAAAGSMMLIMAARLSFAHDDVSQWLSLIYASSGALLNVLAWIVAKHRRARGIPDHWKLIAATGAVVASVNIIVIAGLAF